MSHARSQAAHRTERTAAARPGRRRAAATLAATVVGSLALLAGAQPAGAVSTAERAELRASVVKLTNAARKAAGCDPLKVSTRLTKAAQLHANDMAKQNYFGHTSVDGRQWFERILDTGWTEPGAENIAFGQPTPTRVVKAWMDSPGHRRNIEDCDLEWIGVGFTAKYWVQDFGY